MLMTFFISAGWESWDLQDRPLIPEGMPVLIDDDLLFKDGPGVPRPVVAVNRWLRELPVSGAPAPATWESYGRIVRSWMEFLGDRGTSGSACWPGSPARPAPSRRTPPGRPGS